MITIISLVSRNNKFYALQLDNNSTYVETPFTNGRVYSYISSAAGNSYRFCCNNGFILTLSVMLLDSRYIVYPTLKYYYGNYSDTEYTGVVTYELYQDSSPSYDGYAFPAGVVVDYFGLTLLSIGNNTIKFTFSTATHTGNNQPSFTYSSQVDIEINKSDNASDNTSLFNFLINTYPSTYYWTLCSVPSSYGLGTYEQGYSQGQADAIAANKDIWYQEGYNDAVDFQLEEQLGPLMLDDVISSIILSPVNFVKQVLNFDLFGINLGGVFFAITTIGLLISAFAIVKKFLR